MEKKKGRLSEKALKSNGIEFDEKVERSMGRISEYFLREDSRSQQAWIVTEGLLDFDGILSPHNVSLLSPKVRERIDKKFESCKFRGPSLRERSSPEQMDQYNKKYHVVPHDTRFKLALSISESARNVKATKETRWSAIVKNELFGNLIQSARQAEGMTVFDPMQIVERVRVEDEDIWSRGHAALRRTTPHDATVLTAPKVDLYMALPIVARTSNPKGFHKDDYIQNFTVNVLTKLEEKESGRLISNPLKKMDSNKADLVEEPIEEKYLVCFPSTVVELKHHGVKGSKIRHCYYQAANAASTALSMISRASRYSIPTESFGEIRPVVAFTFIGSCSMVWIAFISGKTTESVEVGTHKKGGKGKKKIQRNLCKYASLSLTGMDKMKCIWKGDLQEVWDNVQLCRIIENLQYWIVRHFRPWISSCIDRWRVEAELKKSKRSPRDETRDDLKFDSASEEGWLSASEEDEFISPGCSSESDEEYELGSYSESDPSSVDGENWIEPEESEGEDDYISSNEDDYFQHQTPKLDLPSQRRSPRLAENPPSTKRQVGRPQKATADMKASPSVGSPTPAPRRRDAGTLSPGLPSRSRATRLHPDDASPSNKMGSKNHNRNRSTG